MLVEKKKGGFSKVAISVGRVSGRATRMKEAEDYLTGRRKVTQNDFAKAAELVAKSCDLVADLEVSKEYKLRMVKVLTRRALTDVLLPCGSTCVEHVRKLFY